MKVLCLQLALQSVTSRVSYRLESCRNFGSRCFVSCNYSL